MKGFVIIKPNSNGNIWEVCYREKLLFQETSRDHAINKANMFAKIHEITLVVIETKNQNSDSSSKENVC